MKVFSMLVVTVLSLIASDSRSETHSLSAFSNQFQSVEGASQAEYRESQGRFHFSIRNPVAGEATNTSALQRQSAVFVEGASEVNQLLAASYQALGAGSIDNLVLVRSRASSHALHHQFVVTEKGLPIRGSDVRVHTDKLGKLVSFNGQRPDQLDALRGFTAQFATAAELSAALISEPDALALAKASLIDHSHNHSAQGFEALSIQLELVDSAPFARYSIDLSQPRGMQRFLIELDASTGEILMVQDRIRLHKPVLLHEVQR